METLWTGDPVVDHTSDGQAVTWLNAVQAVSTLTPEYTVEAVLVDPLTGQPLVDGDISESLSVADDSEVRYDGTTGATYLSCTLTVDAGLALQWGSACVSLRQCVRAPKANLALGFDPATFMRFPVGQFILTSPGADDLDAADVRVVTGYDKNYLLQNPINGTLSYGASWAYSTAVRLVLTAAGVITSGGSLTSRVDFPADWAPKALPAPMSWPVDGNTTYLGVVNELLAASGMKGIFTQPNGRWKIEPLPKTATDSTRWRWAAFGGPTATDAELDARIVNLRSSSYSGDVWNVPNQWVFIQQGLDFTPIEGSGQYTVNNVNTPPGGQAYTGRVIRSTQFLDASGQTDLKTQGNAIVAAALAQAESIRFTTAPWPAARHLDLFQIVHDNLPFDAVRRVQAQQWTLPLWGGPMSWATNAVALTEGATL